jgi:hypothetical protein
MVILNYSGVETPMLAREIDYALGKQYNVEHKEIYTAFPSKEEYNYASEGNVERKGEATLRERSNTLRSEATDLLDQELRNYKPPREAPSEQGGRGVSQPYEAEYGKGIENSSDAIGVHYSKEKRSNLSSQFFGSGLKGLERERLSDPLNSDIKNRLYFYVDKGKGIIPESGVGGVPHVVKLNNLYDVVADPLKIVKENTGGDSAERATNLERKIKDAGFDGYKFLDPLQKQGYAVLVGKHNIDIPKFSLREQMPNEINEMADRITTKRDEKGFVERLLAAISPDAKAYRKQLYDKLRQGLIFKFDPLERQSLEIARE